MAKNVNTDIVATMAARNPAIADKNEYLGSVKRIPFFIKSSVALVNQTDTITFTDILPNGAKASALFLATSAQNGVNASSTLAVTAGGTVLTVTSTIKTSLDGRDGIGHLYPLKHTDVGGKKIIGTVAGADWDDTTDLYGYVDIVLNA
jgi:hypothetical protein